MLLFITATVATHATKLIKTAWNSTIPFKGTYALIPEATTTIPEESAVLHSTNDGTGEEENRTKWEDHLTTTGQPYELITQTVDRFPTWEQTCKTFGNAYTQRIPGTLIESHK